MTQAGNAAEAEKIASETKFATLGRAIADYSNHGEPIQMLIDEVQNLRRIEQDSADKSTQFAALARQVGDAARVGRDTAPLVQQLRTLRIKEIG